MNNRVLITGSTGFIGKSLIKHFRDQGYLVDTLNRSKSAEPLDNQETAYIWNELDEINLSSYQSIVHLAGKAHDTRSSADEKEYDSVNYELAILIFDAWKASGCKTFIFMSTILAVTADEAVELTEDIQGMPESYYGMSKRRAENYMMKHLPIDRGLYILRPSLVYGSDLKGNFEKLLTFIKQGLPLPLGAIRSKRSYLYIQNLNHVILQLISTMPDNGIYHLADDEQIPLNVLIRQMGELLSRNVINIPLPLFMLNVLAKVGDILKLPYNKGVHDKLTKELLVSNSKIKKALNFEKMPFSFHEGLKSIV